jgi:2-oxoglutarate ferredoxin oxidoreductase subunit beta
MNYPEYPVALGVIRAVPSFTYEEALKDQIENVKSNTAIRCMDDLMSSGPTWQV